MARELYEVLRVGSLGPNHRPTWRSADQPAPTIQTSAHGHLGPDGERAGGWIEIGPARDILRVGVTGRFFQGTWRSPDLPAPTIRAGLGGGRGEGGPGTGWIEIGDADVTVETEPSSKPAYRVPSMAEIREIEPNGFTVASTFSGCGGSSLGYRMAGFRVAWASEFVPAAREVYRLNASPDTIVDGRDIRQVKPEEILEAIGMEAGELDLLDGSPPCASFSTAGKRSAGWGKVKTYSDTAQRSDDLFFEYARILAGIRPKTFVAENVSGLVKGSAKGYFKEIMRALRDAGYRVNARLLDAQWLGVPQARQRIIFVGVRDDLGIEPAHPQPLAYRYSVRDALPWVLQQGDNAGFGGGAMRDTDVPSPTIGAGPSTGNGRFPPSKIVAIGTHKGLRSVDEPSPTVLTHGNRFTHSELTAVTLIDPETGESNALGNAVGREWDRIAPGEASDKYFQLKRSPVEGPSQSITATGGTLSIASVTHPTERRKFTIEELRRICGFPDDFALTGTYAQRWERLGRAVPPVMMSHIAATVRDEILGKLS